MSRPQAQKRALDQGLRAENSGEHLVSRPIKTASDLGLYTLQRISNPQDWRR